MIRELLRSKRRLLVAAVLCVVLVAGLGMLWHGGQVAEAAVLNPHPGLVGWWRFDEGSGRVAGDSSGNGNNGTIYGATWVNGKYGKALSFNGTNNYVNIGKASSLSITGALSIEAWMNLSALSSGKWMHVVSKWGDVNANGYLIQVNNLNKIEFALRNVYSNIYSVQSLSAVVTNVWYHVVGTFDGTTLMLYVNGVSQGTATGSIGPNSNIPLHIGIMGESNKNPFNGVIDEVRIYNRALSAAEIQADFKEGPDFSVNLLTKVPKGTTQVITTLSWQGTGSINVTILSPSQNYTESMLPEYQKTVYSTSSGTTSMLNIKRLSVSVSALSSDQNWYVVLTFDSVSAYQITVEVQK